jgi:hypothetical protein
MDDLAIKGQLKTSMTDTDSNSAAAIMFYFALRHEAD